MTTEEDGESITIRPLRPAPSRVGRRLAWLSIPWALAVLLGLDGVLRATGSSLGAQPLLVRVLVITLALAPGALTITGPWLGRLPATGWLLAAQQPEIRLDAWGIRLMLPDRPVQTAPWSDIACLIPANDLRRTSSLVGSEGQVLATIPVGLVMQRARGPGPHSLAEAVVAIRPDRYVTARPGIHGIPTGFEIRTAGASDPAYG